MAKKATIKSEKQSRVIGIENKSLSSVIDQEVFTYIQPVILDAGSHSSGNHVADNKDGGSQRIVYNHYEIIHRINCYANHKFYKYDEPDALFYPIGSQRVPHFAKKLDLDSKDFRMVGLGDANYLQSWIINNRYRSWVNDTHFPINLDDITEGCATYGSSLWKTYEVENPDANQKKYDLFECDYEDIYYDTSLDDISEGSIIELHKMTELELLHKEKIWTASDDKKETTITKALKQAEKVTSETNGVEKIGVIMKFKIWERWGDYRKDGELKYYHHFICGKGDNEVILFEEEKKREDCPYIQFHISKFRNRNLRVGVYERTFGIQEEANILVNYNRKNREIANLLLFISKEQGIYGLNLLEEAESGQVIDSNQLKQLQITSQYFSAFLSELATLELKADKLCLTPDVITGDTLPSGTTFRGQATLTNVATSAFKSARDRIGFNLFKFLTDKVMPAEVEKWNKEKTIKIAEYDEDVRLYDAINLKYYVTEYRIRSLKMKGREPTAEETDTFTNNLVEKWNREGRVLEHGKNFFNFKFGFVMNATGENANQEQRNNAYDNIITRLERNPALANNYYFRQYAEENGITPIRMTMGEIQTLQSNQASPPGTANSQSDKLLSAVKV